MSQIIFCVGQHKRRVIYPIIVVGMRRFAGRRYICGALGCCDGSFTACQANKTCVEIIQPGTQYGAAIPTGISGNKHDLHLLPDLGGQLLQAARDIGHVQWTLIGTMSVAEKEQRDIPLGPRPEIKRRTGRIGESKFWFRQRRAYDSAVVCYRCTARLG